MDLRANTAADVLIGQFVDSADGVTAETALTIAQADVQLSKNGQTLAQKNDATAAAHDADGYYNCELDATDTNTVGQLVLKVSESGALPVRHEFNVLSEAAYDAKYNDGTGAVYRHGIIDSGTAQSATSTTLVLRSAAAFADDELIGATIVITGGTGAGQSRAITDYVSSTDTATVDTWTTTPSGTITYAIFGTAPASTTNPVAANVVQISGDSTAADNLEAAADGTGYNLGGGSVVAASVTGAVGSVTGNVGGSVASVTGNVGGNVVGSVGSVTGHTPQTGDSFARLGAPAGASVSADVAAVKAETASILVDTGTTLPASIATVDGNVDAILVDTGTTLPATLATIAGFLDTEIAAILEDTGTTIPALIAALNDLDAAGIRTAVGLATANLDTQLGDIPTNAELAARTLLAAAYATAASQTTIEGKIDTVDTVADAVKAKTDSLTFTQAGQVDANMQSINDVAVTGNGQTGSEFSV